MRTDRLKLMHAKLVRSFQLLELARNKGKITEEEYQLKAVKYHQRLRELEEKGLVGENEGYFKDLPLPQDIDKHHLEEKKQPNGKSYAIFGGLGLKIFLAIAVFFCISFFLPYLLKLSAPFLLIAFGCPLLYLAIVYSFDKYEPEPMHYVIGAFLWGVTSTILAVFLNGLVAGMAGIFLAIILAGVTEELVKGLGLYRIAKHDEFNDTLDAIVYGFAIGLGFAALENAFYYTQHIDQKIINNLTGMGSAEITFVSIRAFLCALGHAVFTSIIAVCLAKAKLRNGVVTPKDFIGGYLLAALVHGAFNAACLFLGSASVVLNTFIVIGGLVIYWGMIKKSWEKERSWGWHLLAKS